MEHIEREELSETLERINGWIENCDAKVSTILSGMGVFAGILLATDYVSKFIAVFRFMCEKINIWTVVYLAINTLSLCSLIYGTFLLVGVLFARVDPEEFENRGVRNESLIFFSAIAKNRTLSEYKEKLKECSSEQMKVDFISQIYICSLICEKKFSLYKKGVTFSIAGFCIFMITAIIGVAVT